MYRPIHAWRVPNTTQMQWYQVGNKFPNITYLTHNLDGMKYNSPKIKWYFAWTTIDLGKERTKFCSQRASFEVERERFFYSCFSFTTHAARSYLDIACWKRVYMSWYHDEDCTCIIIVILLSFGWYHNNGYREEFIEAGLSQTILTSQLQHRHKFALFCTPIAWCATASTNKRGLYLMQITNNCWTLVWGPNLLFHWTGSGDPVGMYCPEKRGPKSKRRVF